jgi:hypothetical protein
MSIEKPQRQLLTRTATIGLAGDAATQAATVYECVRLIASDHSESEIVAATGLHPEFIAAMQEKFWGD